MPIPVSDAPSPRSKAGRPPKISRASIAEAAHEIGLDGLTMKAVAGHLGVTIAALYHHVSGKDELMRIAAEHSARTVPLPVDIGQHWSQWLFDWALYNHSVFLAQPGLLAQYLEGAISPEVTATNLDRILEVLVREGFSILEASAAYDLVTSCALGSIVSSIREREAAERSDVDLATAYRRILDDAVPGRLPHLRLLLDAKRPGPHQPFEDHIVTVLRGIAIGRGDDPGAIDGLVARRHGP